MEIRILGSGCPRCHELENRTLDVLAELHIAADVQKVTDAKKIIEYGIMATPGLVINGKVMCSGKLPNKEELRKWIEAETA